MTSIPELMAKKRDLELLGWKFRTEGRGPWRVYADRGRPCGWEAMSQSTISTTWALRNVVERLERRMQREAMNEREVLTVVGALTREGWMFTSEGEGSAGTCVTARRGSLEYKATDLTAEGAYRRVVKAIREAENPPPVRPFLNASNSYRAEVEVRLNKMNLTPEEAEGLADSLRAAAVEARSMAVNALPRAAKALEKAHRELRSIGEADSTANALQVALNARRELETLCQGNGMPLPGVTLPERRRHF